MKFLLWFRKILSIVMFLSCIVFVILLFVFKELNFYMWALLIVFMGAIFVWPNATVYCQKCGNKYDEDEMKLLKTYKQVKENPNEKKTTVMYSVGHKCHCLKCKNTFAYTEDVKAGKIIENYKTGITTNTVTPFDLLYAKKKQTEKVEKNEKEEK